MKIEDLKKLMKENQTDKLVFSGTCHDCKGECEVLVDVVGDQIIITGGAVYEVVINGDKQQFVKCEACTKIDKVLRNYQPCEVYTRVVGYLRPVEQMNGAKKCEHQMRKSFDTPDISDIKGVL